MLFRFIILIAAIFFTTCVSAQIDTTFHLGKSYPGEITNFTVDNLGNLYIVYQSGQLKKLDAAGDSVAVFNDVRRYGKMFTIDVSNPLKMLLYSKDFGTVLILDRFLNSRGTIDLRRLNLFQVKAIGQSYDNNIWVFDEQEGRLKKISDDGRVIDQSNDFRLLFDSIPSPQFIVDQNDFVYLYDSTKGIYIFDHYGAFKNRIQLLGWTDFTVINNSMFGRDGKFLYRYETGSLKLQQYSLPLHMHAAQKILITPANLYLLLSNKLTVYSYR